MRLPVRSAASSTAITSRGSVMARTRLPRSSTRSGRTRWRMMKSRGKLGDRGRGRRHLVQVDESRCASGRARAPRHGELGGPHPHARGWRRGDRRPPCWLRKSASSSWAGVTTPLAAIQHVAEALERPSAPGPLARQGALDAGPSGRPDVDRFGDGCRRRRDGGRPRKRSRSSADASTSTTSRATRGSAVMVAGRRASRSSVEDEGEDDRCRRIVLEHATDGAGAPHRCCRAARG